MDIKHNFQIDGSLEDSSTCCSSLTPKGKESQAKDQSSERRPSSSRVKGGGKGERKAGLHDS